MTSKRKQFEKTPISIFFSDDQVSKKFKDTSFEEFYSYSVLNILPPDSKKGILEYSTREEYKNINEIVHPIVREVLSYFNIKNYIELIILLESN